MLIDRDETSFFDIRLRFKKKGNSPKQKIMRNDDAIALLSSLLSYSANASSAIDVTIDALAAIPLFLPQVKLLNSTKPSLVAAKSFLSDVRSHFLF